MCSLSAECSDEYMYHLTFTIRSTVHQESVNTVEGIQKTRLFIRNLFRPKRFHVKVFVYYAIVEVISSKKHFFLILIVYIQNILSNELNFQLLLNLLSIIIITEKKFRHNEFLTQRISNILYR